MRRFPMLLAVAMVLGVAAAEETVVAPEARVSDFDARLTLARALAVFDAGAALREYDRLLRGKGSDATIVRERAGVLVRLGRVDDAARALRELRSAGVADPELLQQLGGLEVQLGRMKEAREAFQAAVANGGKTAEEEHARWRVSWGDFRGAARYWQKRGKRLELADALRGAQEYERAEQELLLVRSGRRVEADLGLANVALMRKDYAAAAKWARAVLAVRPSSPDALAILGEASVKLRQWDDARSAFRRLSGQPGQAARGWIGLGRMEQAAGNPDAAREAFLRARRRDGLNLEARYRASDGSDRKVFTVAEQSTWAGLLAADGRVEEALREYEAVLARQPDYFPARIGEAEALGTLQRYDESVAKWRSLADEFPESYKIRLSLARVLGWSKNYRASLEAYEELSADGPEDYGPVRERARVAAWAKKIREARRVNATLLDPPVDDAVPADGHDDPRKPYDSYERLAAQNPEAALSLAGRYRLQKAVWLEDQSKWLAWNRRFLTSEDRYEELMDFDPGNEEALFDLAQVQAAQRLPGRSITTYERLLAIDPLHNRAAEALRRQKLLLRPAGFADFTFWNEDGGGRNSDITRYQTRTGGETIWKDHFRFRVSGNSWVEVPTQRLGPTPAVGWTAEASGVFDEHWSGALGWTHKIYTRNGLGSTDTGFANLGFNAWDFVRLSLGYARLDELHNGYGLAQKIQSDNVQLTAEARPYRWLTATASGVFQNYSDDNQGVWLWVEPEFQLIDHPHTLLACLRLDFRSMRNQSLDVAGPDGQIADVIHPYWTPQNYLRGQVFLEWRHDLSPEYFIGSELRYYGLRVGGGTDSTNNPNLTVEAELHWEFWDRWTFEIRGTVERSPQWNGASAYTSLSVRF